MANITKVDDEKCYSCGKQCINVEFCGEGGSYDTSEDRGISLPRNIRVKVIANPEFWGFSGVLISGWATFNNGYYDFFDGNDEKHLAYRVCGLSTSGPFSNEARPDVMYRSVYDPDVGITNYNGSTIESKVRGGAEVYLIDREPGLVQAVTSDSESCDTTEPTQVFKKFPENFGWGNKISFKNKIYKNITGAWRLSSFENCNDETYFPSGFMQQCDGTYKQNIIYRDRQFEEFDKFAIRVSGDNNCLQDGVTAGEYEGVFETSGIYRTSGSPFLCANLSYNGSSASGIRNGSSLRIINEVDPEYNKIYTVFDVTHNPTYTSVKFVGTVGSGNISIPIGSSGSWSVLGSYDANTCCGLSAYGVGEDKSLSTQNYHSDFRRVFNNPKNLRQSNRDPEWRYTYDLTGIAPITTGYLIDYTYPSITNSGTVRLESGHPVYEKELSYYGNFFDVDPFNSGVRSDQNPNRMVGRNGTCYSKNATLEIFPDCITQYERYFECDTGTEKYDINRVPRLSFVYRGCNYHENCSFDELGRPIVGWTSGVPSSIEDLKRGLSGQEIHMYINLGTAWGGKYQTCPCSCDEPNVGTQIPDHIHILSPISYPSFPNFDLDPNAYGCQDPLHQLYNYKRWISPNSPPTPSEKCDPLHALPECCNVRQPYTTYGYMMNLCGKETQDRKKVITEAFAKLVQDKTYTNETPEVNINEPMYWAFECPSPAPYSNGNVWSSGLAGADKIQNEAGETYGYWGLSDSNGTLIAPYYRTESGNTECCVGGGSSLFINFSASGTFMNGWPTDATPFLIEMEVDDSCVGCATSNMEPTSLVLTIESLDTKYIHGFGSDSNDAYGFNHCKYGPDYNVVVEPQFSCTSGFGDDYCISGDNLIQDYGNRYTGGTCDCINGFEVALSPVYIEGTQMLKGYISNDLSSPLVEIPSCAKSGSSLFNNYQQLNSSEGFTVFGKFTLMCQGFDSFLKDPYYPEAAYESQTDVLSLVWGNQANCAIHKPARLGDDLMFNSDLYLVNNKFKDLFKKIPYRVIEGGSFDITEGIVPTSFTGINNIFGLCPGDKIYTYGCNVMGDFYGCHFPCSSSPLDYTVCETCPNGTGPGEVTCRCGEDVGYEGIEPRFVPKHYRLNNCNCLCSEPSLIAEYEIQSDWSLSLSSGNPTKAACAEVYWMGASGQDGMYIEPTLLDSSESMGLSLGNYGANDWFEFSHGINKTASGILYRLTEPLKDDCGSISIPTCTQSSCSSDSNVGKATCLDPIYGTGDPSVLVNKKKCHPEIAIVNSITCVSGGYSLKLSREYHEHDRTWYEEIVNGDGDQVCVAKNAGSYTFAGNCTILKYASPSDSVTPASDGPCSINPPSGRHVGQDFTFNTKPVSSGDTIWNYYNLFYQGSFPTSQAGISGTYRPSLTRDGDGNYICGTTGVDPGLSAIFGTGLFLSPSGMFGTTAVNKKHSCIQDISMCGGEIWCNKIFFPRKNYLAGTKVSYFGSPSICLSNNEFKPAYSLGGYEDINPNYLLIEAKKAYVDWCNEENQVSIISGVSIDDTTLIVDDYLPLLGVSHPGWRYTSDTKSCTAVSTGCAYLPPTHSNYTASVGYHSPKTFNQDGFDSMGYYLDKDNTTSSSNCLFSPFKIMLDVECSTNNIRRKGINSDDPTLLTGWSRFPSSACQGMISSPPCSCGGSHCNFDSSYKKSQCKEFSVIGYSGVATQVDYMCSGLQTVCFNCTYGPWNVIQVSSLTSKYIDSDDLEDVPLSGFAGESIGNFSDCSAPSGGPTRRRYWFSPSNVVGWKKSKCNPSIYYKVMSTGWSHYWECDNNAYINPAPGVSAMYSSKCDCETDYTKGLCGAERSTPLPATCAGPADSWTRVYPTGTWWSIDCGCSAKPVSEAECTDSVVKITITEGI